MNILKKMLKILNSFSKIYQILFLITEHLRFSHFGLWQVMGLALFHSFPYMYLDGN